jgi:hypothetical protein
MGSLKLTKAKVKCEIAFKQWHILDYKSCYKIHPTYWEKYEIKYKVILGESYILIFSVGRKPCLRIFKGGGLFDGTTVL